MKILCFIGCIVGLFYLMFGYKETPKGWPEWKYWLAFIVAFGSFVFALYLNSEIK